MSQSDTPLQPPLDDKVTTMTSHLEIDNTDHLVDGPHVSQSDILHQPSLENEVTSSLNTPSGRLG